MDKLLYEEKMATLMAHDRAIEQAKERLWEKPCYDRAVALKKLQDHREELRATLPKPRLVA